MAPEADTLKLVDAPAQIVTSVGCWVTTGGISTVTVMLAHAVVLHVPSALTQ